MVGSVVLIGDDLTAALPELREQAESRMTATCTVDRPDGTPDPVTGVTPADRVYDGRCRVQTWEPHESETDAGARRRTSQRYSVHVPVGSFAPRRDDIVIVTVSADDPHLVGRRYRVAALLHKEAATAYRLGVEDVTG